MCKHKMDATPSFGVTKIPEVPSNPQLTLGNFTVRNKSTPGFITYGGSLVGGGIPVEYPCIP